jgi:hypothetical protein
MARNSVSAALVGLGCRASGPSERGGYVVDHRAARCASTMSGDFGDTSAGDVHGNDLVAVDAHPHGVVDRGGPSR